MQYLNEVKETFQQNANPDYAEKMKKYMKGQFEFYGIKAPKRKQISRPFLDKSSLPPLNDGNEIAKNLWNEPHRELQYFAIELLMKYRPQIAKDQIDLYKWMITSKSWWDTVDPIAIDLVGHYFQKYNQRKEELVYDWMTSENIWLQRTSILFQLKYKENTDITLFEKVVTHCKDSKAFFVKKAVGWALREHAKTDETFVRNFVEQIELQPLSKNEALRNIVLDMQGK